MSMSEKEMDVWIDSYWELIEKVELWEDCESLTQEEVDTYLFLASEGVVDYYLENYTFSALSEDEEEPKTALEKSWDSEDYFDSDEYLDSVWTSAYVIPVKNKIKERKILTVNFDSNLNILNQEEKVLEK